MNLKDNLWLLSRTTINGLTGLYNERYSLIANSGYISSSDSVMDIACGIGQYSKIKCKNYIGVDFNKSYIDYAEQNNKRTSIKFLHSNAFNLDFSQKMDIILIVDFIHHLKDEEVIDLFSKLKKMTNKYLMVLEPVLDDVTSPITKFTYSCDEGKYIRSSKDIDILLKKSGYALVSQQFKKISIFNTIFEVYQ